MKPVFKVYPFGLILCGKRRNKMNVTFNVYPFGLFVITLIALLAWWGWRMIG